jgi:N-acetylglutamate synthase-like GNAT family acetyltransferase
MGGWERLEGGGTCLTFCLASTSAERQAALELRRAVGLEVGRGVASHASDALDAFAEILLVKNRGRVVGTVRTHSFAHSASRAVFAGLFELHGLAALPAAQVMVSTELAIAFDHRHSSVGDLLFEGLYDRGLMAGARLVFAACGTPWVWQFRRQGFREFAAPVLEAGLGRLHRMLLVLDDIEDLARVRPTYVPIALRHGVRGERRVWLDEAVASYRNRHLRLP